MTINTGNIFKAMATQGINRAELAKKSGVSVVSVRDIVSGKRTVIMPATAGALASALGIDVLDIVTM